MKPADESIWQIPAAHEDAVDLLEREFAATVVAAAGYDERRRALRRDARQRMRHDVEERRDDRLDVDDEERAS
jgi:hypothetical protein